VGRVYKIVGFRQLLSVKPAPTLLVGLRRVYFTCLFVSNIVGEPARCILKSEIAICRWVGRVYKIVGFRQLLSVKPAPTGLITRDAKYKINSTFAVDQSNLMLFEHLHSFLKP